MTQCDMRDGLGPILIRFDMVGFSSCGGNIRF